MTRAPEPRLHTLGRFIHLSIALARPPSASATCRARRNSRTATGTAAAHGPSFLQSAQRSDIGHARNNHARAQLADVPTAALSCARPGRDSARQSAERAGTRPPAHSRFLTQLELSRVRARLRSPWDNTLTGDVCKRCTTRAARRTSDGPRRCGSTPSVNSSGVYFRVNTLRFLSNLSRVCV